MTVSSICRPHKKTASSWGGSCAFSCPPRQCQGTSQQKAPGVRLRAQESQQERGPHHSGPRSEGRTRALCSATHSAPKQTVTGEHHPYQARVSVSSELPPGPSGLCAPRAALRVPAARLSAVGDILPRDLHYSEQLHVRSSRSPCGLLRMASTCGTVHPSGTCTVPLPTPPLLAGRGGGVPAFLRDSCAPGFPGTGGAVEGVSPRTVSGPAYAHLLRTQPTMQPCFCGCTRGLRCCAWRSHTHAANPTGEEARTAVTVDEPGQVSHFTAATSWTSALSCKWLHVTSGPATSPSGRS